MLFSLQFFIHNYPSFSQTHTLPQRELESWKEYIRTKNYDQLLITKIGSRNTWQKMADFVN